MGRICLTVGIFPSGAYQKYIHTQFKSFDYDLTKLVPLNETLVVHVTARYNNNTEYKYRIFSTLMILTINFN